MGDATPAAWVRRRRTPRAHQNLSAESDRGVFTNQARGPLRRTLFRSRVWRPAPVPAGLLGEVIQEGDDKWRAIRVDKVGLEHTKVVTTEKRALAEVARNQYRGLTFHQLRHSYGTWLVSDGVPINDVQRLMGHAKASATLDLYVHHQKTLDGRVTELFDDFLMTPDHHDDSNDGDEDEGDGS
ncbi:MAG: tyrosine-type recombinase/integrase [Jiangellaceae bacterium]